MCVKKRRRTSLEVRKLQEESSDVFIYISHNEVDSFRDNVDGIILRSGRVAPTINTDWG